jgi:hypothetical protein
MVRSLDYSHQGVAPVVPGPHYDIQPLCPDPNIGPTWEGYQPTQIDCE